MTETPNDDAFWQLAAPLLAQPGVTRSTMMGFACLRLHGEFFASCDHRSGELVVKLNEARVTELVAGGKAMHFAPAGRPFREWATVPVRRRSAWGPLIDEALELAAARLSSDPPTADRAKSGPRGRPRPRARGGPPSR